MYSETLYNSVREINDKAIYVKELNNIPEKLKEMISPDSIILFLGAGTVSNLAHGIVEAKEDKK